MQSILKTTKPINVGLEQDWKKTFSMTRHSKQSRDLLIDSLILAFLFTWVHGSELSHCPSLCLNKTWHQEVKGLSDAFVVCVYWLFFFSSDHRLPFEANLQIFPLAIFGQHHKTVSENIKRTPFGWNLNKGCSLGVLLTCCTANGHLIHCIHRELLYYKKSV